jgi:uncharacterized protein YlzI (FlbEa/FlbD family)
MYNYIIVHDADTQATISININHIESITRRDDGGSLIVTDIGHSLKVKESVSEVARKIAFITERS